MIYARLLTAGWCASLIAGCSSTALYNSVQGVAYQRCESMQDASERARCKAANYPDEEKYKMSVRLPQSNERCTAPGNC